MKKKETIEGWRSIMMIGAAVIVILSGILIYVVIIEHTNQEKSTLAARVESCKNFNRSQTANRKHDHDFILKLVELRGGQAAVDQVTQDPRLAELDQFSAEFYAYRNCTPPCVKAFFDAKIDDCLPASNEAGNT